MITIRELLVFGLVLGFVHGYAVNTGNGCKFRVSKDLSQTAPLFLIPKTTDFVRGTDTRGTVTFKTGESMVLACPGKRNSLELKGHKVQEALASCVSGNTFEINGQHYSTKEIRCSESPVSEQKITGTCLKNYKQIDIGFPLSNGFSKLIEVCHDTKNMNTLYSKYILRPDAAGAQKGVARALWSKGNLFENLNVDRLYKRTQEQITVGGLLGSPELGKKYIDLESDFFMAKGHLVAKSDLFYGAQQSATFWYSNAAPQWQTFNGENWNFLEQDVRAFAGKYGHDLDVYTGTHGITTLPDIKGHEVKLSLDGKGKMPVPEIYWKIVHDPIKHTGTVFIGVNNPYKTLDEIEKSLLCKDICNQIDWLTWNPRNLTQGYSYCCDVNEFAKKVTTFPKLEIKSILK